MIRVEFNLLDTEQLNERGMRGPNQYLNDPIPRAEKFILKLVRVQSQYNKVNKGSMVDG